MTILETNDDFKQKLKNISSDESNLDLNKIMKFTEKLIKDQEKSPYGKGEALEETSLKGLSSLVKEENLDSLVKIAKNLVNPTTLSLLSKTNNTSDSKEISNLKLSVENLSDELDKVQKESEEQKLHWKEIKSQYTELQSRFLELERNYTDLQSKVTSLRRRRR